MESTTAQISEGRERLAARLAEVSAVSPEDAAIYFGGATYARGQLLEAAQALGDALDRAGVPPGAPVAWVARNEPGVVGAVLGILMSRRCVSLINPHEPAAKVAAAVRALKAPAIVAAERDWTAELDAAAARSGAAAFCVSLSAGAAVRPRPAAERVRGEGFHSVGADIAVELLTSGTTGEPKRLPLGAERLLTGLSLGIRKDRHAPGIPAETLQVKRSPSLVANPMSHVGGFFRVLLSIIELRPIALRERFRVDEFVEDMRRFRPKSVGLVPAMAAMVLEADVPPDVFADVILVRSGTAPLAPPIKAAFEARYGVPILSEYGASEFFGGVTVWTLGDYQAHGAAKAGSVGRPKPDVAIKIVGADSGLELPADEVGILHLKSPRFGPDWIATTDLASRDADGFVYIHGRSDQAIIRGGFKILPEKVAEVFRQREDVGEACVIGVKDDRLGAAPLLVVEPAPGHAAPSPEALQQFARENLAPYQAPVAYEVLPELPRTATMKVAIGKVRELLADRYNL